MNIQAVIFDFGRVISDFDIGRFVAHAAHFSTLTAAALKETEPHMMQVAGRYETGLITSREFYLEVCRIASLSVPEEEFVRGWTDIFTPKPATLELVKRLKGRYRLGLLSNTNEWHFEFGIKPVGIFHLFDAVTLSFEVHAMKPDRKMYDDMLAKLALPAAACVYIDDIAEYVAAGRAIGLHGIRYTTHEKLLEDLAKAGVEVPLH